jgi:DNA polymerase-3 subunit epsilon
MAWSDVLQRWRHRRRCLRLARACAQPVLRDYLEACGKLDIGDIADTPLIAVDLELTGLDKNSDHIIAMGWTQIDRGRIQVGSNRHLLISSERSVGASAAIHELMDNEVAQGADVEDGLAELFQAARGRVWVFHHAGLDVGFLKKACARWARVLPGFIVLDTMRIEYRQRKRRDIPVRQGDLQLGRIRSLYGLPRYTAHNALNDAFATAELILAIAASMERDAPLRLAPHLKFF